MALLGLSSCSLIFPQLLPPECSEGAVSFCRDNVIVSCQEGFEAQTACGAGELCSQLLDGAACIAPNCGDGIVSEGEECDDANLNNGDGCDEFCVIEIATCGNGILEFNESCDDANLNNGDGCDATCVLESCGNQSLDPGEQCEDGNREDGDGCEGNCLLVCGQGSGAQRAIRGDNGHCYLGFSRDNNPNDIISWPEAQVQCRELGGYLVTIEDSTENALARSTILSDELAPWIGLTDFAIEEDLDDGLEGDDFVWINQQPTPFRFFGGGEPNDDGIEDCAHFFSIGVADPAGWNDNFCHGSGNIINTAFICEIEPAPCGDRVLHRVQGEECDDGNLSNGDGCSSTCLFEANGVCGNRSIEPDESCDDGNTTNGDGCNAECQNEAGHFFEIEGNDDGTPSIPPDPDNNAQLEGNDFDPDAANVLPSTDLLIHGSIVTIGDDDYFEFTNTTNNSIFVTAQIFLGGVGRCDQPGDPALNVRDAAGNVLEVRDDDLGLCPTSSGDIAPGERLFFGVVDFGEQNPLQEYLFAFSLCGDGVLVTAEQCDDGNFTNGDGCDNNCTFSACGNGVEGGVEQCDDGNSNGGDGCDVNCIDEFCGDGVINNGFEAEQCDDGNAVNGDGCSAVCRGEPDFFCANTTVIDGSITGNNTGGSVAFEIEVATNDPFCSLGAGAFGSENVFSFIPAVTGQLQLDLSSQDDLVLSARGDCLDPLSQLGCSDEIFSGTETIVIGVTAGDVITIIVDGFLFGQDGPYTLNITPL
jgi:cysteine-rich repeat protein